MKTIQLDLFVNNSFEHPILHPNQISPDRAKWWFGQMRKVNEAAISREVYPGGPPAAKTPQHRDTSKTFSNPLNGDNNIHRCRESHLARTGRRY